MAERQFKDCDGDTWTEYAPGWLRLTERASGAPVTHDCECSIEDARDDHGPLTEIRPDVDVRAVVAAAFEDLAERMSTLIPDGSLLKDVEPYLRLADAAEHVAAKLREENA